MLEYSDFMRATSVYNRDGRVSELVLAFAFLVTFNRSGRDTNAFRYSTKSERTLARLRLFTPFSYARHDDGIFRPGRGDPSVTVCADACRNITGNAIRLVWILLLFVFSFFFLFNCCHTVFSLDRRRDKNATNCYQTVYINRNVSTDCLSTTNTNVPSKKLISSEFAHKQTRYVFIWFFLLNSDGKREIIINCVHWGVVTTRTTTPY